MSRIHLHKNFGLPANPWKTVAIDTADAQRVRDAIDAVVDDHEMVGILGERGQGKSRAVEAAIAGHPNAQIVDVLRLERERMHMGDILDALIHQLGNENAKRSGEARSRQVRRILGNAAQRGPVVLVVDDAHRLHRNTLVSLKRLRELAWMGRSPLLGIVLIAQRDPLHGIDEVRLRADEMWMEGPTRDEVASAIDHAMGRVFEPEAITALAQSKNSRNWLNLQEAATHALATAQAHGHAKVTVSDVVQVTDGGLKALASHLNVTGAEIARAVGRSESQVSRVMSGERDDAALQASITDFLLGRQAEGGAQRLASVG